MRNIHEELLELAVKNRDSPLIILGHRVDKANIDEVNGALVWIEDNLIGLMARKQVEHQNELRRVWKTCALAGAILTFLFLVMLLPS